MQDTLNVTGMTCGHCEAAVKNAILELDPQAQVRIDRVANRVDVDSSAPHDAVVTAIREQGYEVTA